MTVALIIVWLVVAALIITSKPLRSRADCWCLGLLWPCALALVVAILFYELAIYRPFVRPIVHARHRRSEMLP